MLIKNQETESILESGRKGYRLKQGIQFHLYINTAPCGDARIFSPHEDSDSVDKHPNRRARGQLRTKIESGEGTIPVKSSEGIQTWDGVLMVNINTNRNINSFFITSNETSLINFF